MVNDSHLNARGSDLWKMHLRGPRSPQGKSDHFLMSSGSTRYFVSLMHRNKGSGERINMRFGMPSTVYLQKLGKVDLAFTDLSI